ncbi:hypothetical protein SAMN05421841_3990 [Chryseobacterium wanjuense]|uniref:4Fe-4S ferredoxin-type domain-containing protein n=1 Tax=Chryseobacterium wanjuense TaxID=356305 RepID=A0A1I0S2P5_9FLAO|nr:DUF2321 domain-containing protein [Chryseobacterium wanjuense]SEW49050.1 hypothetical protein SAMN05421841_3990 [Chryseobacterium wanjuense]
MGHYDAYLVCENGHGVNDSFYKNPEFNKNFCTTCGAKTLKNCPTCGKEIQGDYHIEGVIDLTAGPTPVPDICKYCGTDFPWKSIRAKIAENVKSTNKDDILILETIMDKFHLVVKQIRQRYNDRTTLDVEDEYDVQDLLHSLLKIYYDDIRTEEWNPSYAGSSTRSDFLLKNEKIVIEVKKTRNTLRAKQLGEQLIIDIAKYKTHPDCNLLFCFVYDPDGYINNPIGIENDLKQDRKEEMQVKVKIIPKGH